MTCPEVGCITKRGEQSVLHRPLSMLKSVLPAKMIIEDVLFAALWALLAELAADLPATLTLPQILKSARSHSLPSEA